MKRKRRRNKSDCTEAPDSTQAPVSISSQTAWRWKREAQARDRELIASGKIPPESMFLIRPEMIKGAKIVWPDDPALFDDPLNFDDLPEPKRKRSKPKRAKKTGARKRIVKTEDRS